MITVRALLLLTLLLPMVSVNTHAEIREDLGAEIDFHSPLHSTAAGNLILPPPIF